MKRLQSSVQAFVQLSVSALAVMFVGFAGSNSQASVWSTTSSWSESSEQEFGQWIANLRPDVFSNPKSRYYGIATDCADAAYALRTIFAAEHGLPVNFQGSFSNSSTRFDSEPTELARVKQFIKWINTSTGTASLAKDTYPVAINSSTIRPGVLFVHAATSNPSVSITYRSGHVYYLQDVNTENGLITYISSTVPAAVRTLNLKYGITFAPQDTSSGYRAWKWSDSTQRPGQSDEQYRIGGWKPGAYGDQDLWVKWQEAVQSRLRSRPLAANERSEVATMNLRSVLQQRVSAVKTAWLYYKKHYGGKGCMNATDYENYSTSTRDVKIQEALVDFQQSSGGSSDFEFEVAPGYSQSFTQLYQTFMSHKVLEISEPEHSPLVRWGVQDQGAWVCPQRAKQYKGGEQIDPYAGSAAE